MNPGELRVSRILQDLSRALEAASAGPVAWAGPAGAWHQRAMGHPHPALEELCQACQDCTEMLSAALGWYEALGEPEEPCPLTIVLDEPLSGTLLERLESVAARRPDLLILLLDLGRRYHPMAQGGWRPFGQDSRKSEWGAFLKPYRVEFLGSLELGRIERTVREMDEALQGTGPRLLHLVGREGAGTLAPEEGAYNWRKSGETAAGPAPETLEATLLSQYARESSTDGKLRIFWARANPPRALAALGERVVKVPILAALAEAKGAAAAGFYPVVAVSARDLPDLMPQLMAGLRHPGTLLVLGGGLSFEPGDTALAPACLRDLAMLRLISGLAIVTPADLEEGLQLLRFARQTETPVALRLTSTPYIGVRSRPGSFSAGQSSALRKGDALAILALGSTVFPSLLAAEGMSSWGVEVAVFDVRFLKPMDLRSLEAAAQCPHILTVEEHCIQGGLSTVVLESLQTLGVHPNSTMGLGLPTHPPVAAGAMPEQFDLHAEGIQRAVRACLGLDRAWA